MARDQDTREREWSLPPATISDPSPIHSAENVKDANLNPLLSRSSKKAVLFLSSSLAHAYTRHVRRARVQRWRNTSCHSLIVLHICIYLHVSLNANSLSHSEQMKLEKIMTELSKLFWEGCVTSFFLSCKIKKKFLNYRWDRNCEKICFKNADHL